MSNIVLEFVLIEEPPDLPRVELARIDIPLDWFPPNSVVRESFRMKPLIDSFTSPLLFLEVHRNEEGARPWSGSFSQIIPRLELQTDFTDEFRTTEFTAASASFCGSFLGSFQNQRPSFDFVRQPTFEIVGVPPVTIESEPKLPVAPLQTEISNEIIVTGGLEMEAAEEQPPSQESLTDSAIPEIPNEDIPVNSELDESISLIQEVEGLEIESVEEQPPSPVESAVPEVPKDEIPVNSELEESISPVQEAEGLEIESVEEQPPVLVDSAVPEVPKDDIPVNSELDEPLLPVQEAEGLEVETVEEQPPSQESLIDSEIADVPKDEIPVSSELEESISPVQEAEGLKVETVEDQPPSQESLVDSEIPEVPKEEIPVSSELEESEFVSSSPFSEPRAESIPWDTFVEEEEEIPIETPHLVVSPNMNEEGGIPPVLETADLVRNETGVIGYRSIDLSQCDIVHEFSFFPDPEIARQYYAPPQPLNIKIEPIE